MVLDSNTDHSDLQYWNCCSLFLSECLEMVIAKEHNMQWNTTDHLYTVLFLRSEEIVCKVHAFMPTLYDLYLVNILPALKYINSVPASHQKCEFKFLLCSERIIKSHNNNS